MKRQRRIIITNGNQSWPKPGARENQSRTRNTAKRLETECYAFVPSDVTTSRRETSRRPHARSRVASRRPGPKSSYTVYRSLWKNSDPQNPGPRRSETERRRNSGPSALRFSRRSVHRAPGRRETPEIVAPGKVDSASRIPRRRGPRSVVTGVLSTGS